MRIDYQKPFEMRSSIFGLILTITVSALIFVWLGFAYRGEILVVPGLSKGRDSETFAGFLLLITVPFFCYHIYKSVRMNPLKPPLILSPEGVTYRGFSSSVVPWQMIAAIEVRHIQVRGGGWSVVELMLADHIGDKLRAASLKSASISYRPGVPHISIPTYRLFGPGSGEIVAIIKHYHLLYGPTSIRNVER
jgi:hypothetical protein